MARPKCFLRLACTLRAQFFEALLLISGSGSRDLRSPPLSHVVALVALGDESIGPDMADAPCLGLSRHFGCWPLWC